MGLTALFSDTLKLKRKKCQNVLLLLFTSTNLKKGLKLSECQSLFRFDQDLWMKTNHGVYGQLEQTTTETRGSLGCYDDIHDKLQILFVSELGIKTSFDNICILCFNPRTTKAVILTVWLMFFYTLLYPIIQGRVNLFLFYKEKNMILI